MSTSAIDHNTEKHASPAGEARRYFHAPNGWGVPLVFLLSMSAAGLSFYPAWVVIIGLIFAKLRSDRYEALIMILMTINGMGLVEAGNLMACAMVFVVCLPLMLLLRKDIYTRRALTVWAVYALSCVVLATYSIEPLLSQSLTLMRYLSFIFFLFPLWLFAGKSFSMEDFFNRLYPYAVILAAYYWIDGLILGMPVMMPYTQPSVGVMRFYELYIRPFHFARVYPPGAYMMLMLIYPLMRTHKLRPWELVLFGGVIVFSRTFSLIAAVMVGIVICQRSFTRVSKYLVLASVAFFGLAGLDFAISDMNEAIESNGSKLRIASTLAQFTILENAEDMEDLSEFGSTRMAQVIPKVERLYQMGSEWTGFGFLHPTKTDNPTLIIVNEYYSDISENVESVAAVELIPVQVFLNTGYIGLVLHILYLIGLYLVVRRLRDSSYFLTLMIMFAVIGIGGFSGLIYLPGQSLCATAFAMILLTHKTETAKRPLESPVLVARRRY